jgi:hypothetical protein
MLPYRQTVNRRAARPKAFASMTSSPKIQQKKEEMNDIEHHQKERSKRRNVAVRILIMGDVSVRQTRLQYQQKFSCCERKGLQYQPKFSCSERKE